VPVGSADTQPAQETTSTTGDPGMVNPGTRLPDSEVGGTETDRGGTPAPARSSQQLSQTGDGTRRLMILGGVALLIGALVIAFTGRDRPLPLALGSAAAVGPARRRPRPRRELDGWEDGIPLAPAKRELARHRLGLSAAPLDDEPGV
jgi:hypothetical protein